MIQATENVSELAPLLKTRYAGGRRMKGSRGCGPMRKEKGFHGGERRLARNDMRRTALDDRYARKTTRGYGGRQRSR